MVRQLSTPVVPHCHAKREEALGRPEDAADITDTRNTNKFPRQEGQLDVTILYENKKRERDTYTYKMYVKQMIGTHTQLSTYT